MDLPSLSDFASFETVLPPLLLALTFLFMLLVVLLWFRTNALMRKYRTFMLGNDAASLEGLLTELTGKYQEQSEILRDLRFALRELEARQERAVQRVGIVRFNAFPNTGSNLSFAIAVLDGDDNGFVLSSLYGRDESRVYAKPVRQGHSPYHLSEEEKAAIQKARAD
ncbi:MAG: DUF4446 family protein [Firmicutes bacterium]|jgi:Zn-dependent protease with chaperone function|nr:DUF4446 family protein [Bacillota bacterium]